jgi:hypothetical protein
VDFDQLRIGKDVVIDEKNRFASRVPDTYITRRGRSAFQLRKSPEIAIDLSLLFEDYTSVID